jgi:hypothetical protein
MTKSKPTAAYTPKLFSVLALVALLGATLPAHAEREGTASGGGGGGLCDESGCKTLSQAGLRIAPEAQVGVLLDPSVVREVRAVLSKIPVPALADKIAKAAIGDSETFRVVSQENAVHFAAFRQEYVDLLKKYGSGIDQSKLQLIAVSDHSHTYFILDPSSPAGRPVTYFEKLNTRGKALILVHEAMIRSFKAAEVPAIRFDGLLQDLLDARDKRTYAKILFPLLEAAYEAKAMKDELDHQDFGNPQAPSSFTETNNYLNYAVLQALVHVHGGTMKAEKLCKPVVITESDWGNNFCAIDMEQALRFQSISPSLPKLLAERYLSMYFMDMNALIDRDSGVVDKAKEACTLRKFSAGGIFKIVNGKLLFEGCAVQVLEEK